MLLDEDKKKRPLLRLLLDNFKIPVLQSDEARFKFNSKHICSKAPEKQELHFIKDFDEDIFHRPNLRSTYMSADEIRQGT